MKDLVRHSESIPTSSMFASSEGTPIIINTDTGRLYMLIGGLVLDSAESAIPQSEAMTVATARYHTTGIRYALTGNDRVNVVGTGRIRVNN